MGVPEILADYDQSIIVSEEDTPVVISEEEGSTKQPFHPLRRLNLQFRHG